LKLLGLDFNFDVTVKSMAYPVSVNYSLYWYRSAWGQYIICEKLFACQVFHALRLSRLKYNILNKKTSVVYKSKTRNICGVVKKLVLGHLLLRIIKYLGNYHATDCNRR